MNDISILEFTQNEHGSIWVYEDNTARCMSFVDPTTLGHNRQTCILLENNVIPYFKYYKMILGSLYIQPDPKKILIVGLGGGGIIRSLNFLKPNVEINAVEINPEVVRVAKKYFYLEGNAKTKIHIEDGFTYIKGVLKNNIQYDLIIIDAFTDNYIPKKFLTLDFIKMLKGILSENGVIAFNTFTHSQFYSLESMLFKETFGGYYNLSDNNRIIIAKNGKLPGIISINTQAKRLKSKFKKLEIDIGWLLSKFEYVD